MSASQHTRPVYTVLDRADGHRSIWTRIGTAYTNRDGSITVRLDALPVNGVLQIRDADTSASGDAQIAREGGPR